MADTATADTRDDAITREAPGGPPQPLADGATVDLDLTEFGLDPIEPETPAAETPTPAAIVAETSAPAVSTPETPPAEREPAGDQRPERRPAGDDTTRALRESRARERISRREAEHYRRVAEQTQGRAPVDPGLSFPEVAPKLSAADRKSLIEAVDKAASLGESATVLVDAVEQLVAEGLKKQRLSFEVGLRQREVLFMEREFTRENPDYREKLAKAGVMDMLPDARTGQPGSRYNAEVTRAIAEAANPVAASYYIAKAILGEPLESRHPAPGAQDEPTTPADPPPPRSAPATPTDRPAAAPRPSAPAAAANGGPAAPRPAERVIETSARPQGVRNLPPAGAPTGPRRLDEAFRKQLDAHLRGGNGAKPWAVMELFKKRDDIRRWYEGDV